MQTISIPYRCSDEGHGSIAELRRIYSSAVRTAYANAMGENGRLVPEKDLRHLVKQRHAGGAADAWLLHCATLEGREMRKRVPDGTLVFGGRKHLLRRNDGLIDNAEWRMKRLLPLASRGDKLFLGNRHFRLSADARTCRMAVYGKAVELSLAKLTGNAGEILRQAATLAADKQINVMFRIDSTHLHVTIDPMDLPNHPERRRPLVALPGRAVGIDLNPGSIGVAAVLNTNPQELEEARLLETFLAEIDLPAGSSDEQMRELLAGVCDRTISLARKHRAGTIVVEKGLGKLRSRGKNRALNRKLNFWCRTVLVHMLTRKARLAGLKVIEVWSGYSTTIGNLVFEAPDACASAAEIGRRGLARAAGCKDVLPAMVDEVVLRRWKDEELPTPHREMLRRSRSWGLLHRGLKTARLGARRPHPTLSGLDAHGTCHGHAVRRLGLKHRHGLLWRPAHAPDRVDEIIGLSTRKSE